MADIDAVFKAIERITGMHVTLREYQVRSVTVGEDAQGEAQVEAEYNGKVVQGRGISTDIIEASALAFLQGLPHIRLEGAVAVPRGAAAGVAVGHCMELVVTHGALPRKPR